MDFYGRKIAVGDILWASEQTERHEFECRINFYCHVALRRSLVHLFLLIII